MDDQLRLLTSHPSYSLLLLLTAPIPATMVLMTINHVCIPLGFMFWQQDP
jgi:hypothetical protein